eukprot:gene11739-biopygen4881
MGCLGPYGTAGAGIAESTQNDQFPHFDAPAANQGRLPSTGIVTGNESSMTAMAATVLRMPLSSWVGYCTPRAGGQQPGVCVQAVHVNKGFF